MKLATSLLIALLLKGTIAFGPSIHPNEKPLIATKAISLPKTEVYDKQETASAAGETKNKALAQKATLRKKWGVDQEECYWSDYRIHTLGNSGFWGAVHAAVAPLSTKIIDVAAYQGVDVRKKLAEELSTIVGKQQARVVDLCCGVGFSTRALQNAFPDAETVVGIDTSAEMVAMANFLTKHLAMVQPFFETAASQMTESYKAMQKKGYALKKVAVFKAIRFARSNAEDTKLPDKSFDLVTVMWAFHEAPMKGREKILKEARRLLSIGGTLAIVDISTDYVPSENMLKGEPYVQEYQQNIHRQLQKFKGFQGAKYRTIIPHQLGMWTLTRSAIA